MDHFCLLDDGSFPQKLVSSLQNQTLQTLTTRCPISPTERPKPPVIEPADLPNTRKEPPNEFPPQEDPPPRELPKETPTDPETDKQGHVDLD